MVEAAEEAGENIKTAVQQHKEVTQRQEEVELEVRQALCDYFETTQGQGVIYLTVTLVDLIALGIITYFTGGLTALPLVGGLTGATSGAITGAMQESEFSDEAFYNVTKNMFDSTLYWETLGVIGAIAPQLFTNPVSITMTDAGLETLLDSVYALKEDVTLTLSTVMWGFLSNVVTEGALPFKQIDELLSHFKGVKNLDEFVAVVKRLTKKDYWKSIKISDEKMYQVGQHFNKHGRDMGYASKKEYEEGARKFFNDYAESAEIYEGIWNSSHGIQSGETQIIIRAEGMQLIINKNTGQIIDFYEGISLDGFIDIERMQ